MKKQGAESNIIIKALSKMIFCHTKDFKVKVNPEDIIKAITSWISRSKSLMLMVWVLTNPLITSFKNIVL